jgi:predicted aminopeptidase
MNGINSERFVSFFPVFAAAALLLTLCALFSGCYTLKQGSTMLGYLSRAVPVESLIEAKYNNDGTEIAEVEKNRLFVALVQDIRRFAIEELGLKMSKNYTKYVQIDQDYLAAVVSASAADSFARHEWKFPVVGAMPYKGFFNVEDARKERAKLEKKGLDVWIRGVDAFSTLGWFKDPLYSYMQDYPPDRLADLIIHESLHATVFIKNQVQFNEELAEFVGSEGARLYMESRYGVDSQEYLSMLRSEENNRYFVVFIQELIAELQALYKDPLYTSDTNREKIILEKEKIIKAAQERFDAEYESRFTSTHYRAFSTLPVNNAYLELYRLYYAEDAFIADLYRKSGKDLSAFIEAAKTMPKKGNGRLMLAKALGL